MSRSDSGADLDRHGSGMMGVFLRFVMLLL